MSAQTDTRTRIQDVAVRLFTERGYEATSLREIAEALGVTKAALYYHFRSKEDIVASLFEDRVKALDELIAWARRQPMTRETRREVVRRYSADLIRRRNQQVMHLMERNQAALHDLSKVKCMRERMSDLLDVLNAPGDPLTDRLRRTLALFTLHAAWFLLHDDDLTPERRTEAALEVAMELIDTADRSVPGRNSGTASAG